MGVLVAKKFTIETAVVTVFIVLQSFLGFTQPFIYCTAHSTFSGTNIGNVSLGTLNNPIGGCTPSINNPNAINTYSNFTTTISPPNLIQGVTYNFSSCQIEQSGLGVTFSNYFNAFIDYNIDGEFDPVTERVFSAGLTSINNMSVSGNITIPFTASIGITRLRVMMVETANSSFHPCSSFSWGETEDYNVNIVAGLPCGTPVIPGITVSSVGNCNIPKTLSITGNSTIGSGQTWQWDSSIVSCTGPWSPIIGAQSPSYTTFIHDTTYYRCTIVCGSDTAVTSCESININPLEPCFCNVYHYINCNNAWISNVLFNTLNNSSSCDSTEGTAYSIYPINGSFTTSLVHNTPYVLTVTTDGSPQTISAWIDLNFNNSFDASEWYPLTGSPPVLQPSGIYSIPITIPPNFITGLTGLRIRSRQTAGSANNASAACINFGSGETEDYFITINSSQGMNDFQSNNTLAKIYVSPNPTTSTSTITAPSFTHSTLSLYDLTGRLLLQQPFNEEATVDVSALRPGMYLVEVRDKEGRCAKGKMVRE